MAEVGRACGEKGSAKPITGDDMKTLDLCPQFAGECCWQPWSIYAEANNTTSEWPCSSLFCIGMFFSITTVILQEILYQLQYYEMH